MKCIYLIKAELDGIVYYKIGITKNEPTKRLKQLQTGNALQLELIETFFSNYGDLVESTLHRMFSIENEKGEWFSLTKEQVNNFITTCTKIENNVKCIYEQNTYVNKNL